MSVHSSLQCSWTCLFNCRQILPLDLFVLQPSISLCYSYTWARLLLKYGKIILLSYLGCFVFLPCNFVPFQASEWLFCGPQYSLRMIIFFPGITKSIPSLFRGIFLEWNFVANPNTSSGSCAASAPISTFKWIHVSDLYIPRIDPHISCSRVHRQIDHGVYVKRSQTHECGMLLHNSFSGNLCFQFSLQCSYNKK